MARQPLALEAADGDLLLLARIDAAGAVLETAQAWAPAPALSLSAQEGERVVGLVLAASQVVDPAGRPVELASAGLRVLPRSRAAEAGQGCGRCLGWSPRPPAVLSPGELCPLPPFTRVFGVSSPEEADRLRAALLISWPGECACPAPPMQAGADPLSLELVRPAGFFMPEVIALGRDGGAAVLTQRELRWFPRAGEPLALAEQRYAGPLLGAALEGDRLWVVSHQVGGLVDTRLDLLALSARGPSPVAQIADLSIRPAWVAATAAGVVVAGHSFARRRYPAALLCAGDAVCEALSEPAWEGPAEGQDVQGVVQLPEGDWVLLLTHGLGLVELGATPRRRLVSVPPLDPSDPVLRAVASVGRRVYVCAQAGDEALLLSALVPPDVARGGPAPELSVVTSPIPGTCLAFSDEPAPPGSLRLSTTRRAVLITGLDVQPAPAWPAEFTPGAALLAQPGVLLGLGFDGRVWRLAPSGPVELLHGLAADPPAGSILLARGSGALAVGPGGEVLLFDRAETPPEVRQLAGLAGATIHGAGADPGGQEALLLGERQGAPWLGRLTLDGLVVEELPAAAATAPLRGGAGAGGGRYLVHDGRDLFLWDGAALSAVEIDYDDPSTPAREGPPGACDPPRPGGAVWRAVSAAGGFAWAAGCDGALVRVHSHARPAFAERVGLARPSHQLLADGAGDDLSAVEALCADRVFVGALGDSVQTREIGRLLEVGPAELEPEAELLPTASGLILRDAPGLDAGRASDAISSGEPRALRFDGRSLALLFASADGLRGAAITLGGRRRHYLGDPLVEARVLAGGRLLVASRSGRLYLGPP